MINYFEDIVLSKRKEIFFNSGIIYVKLNLKHEYITSHITLHGDGILDQKTSLFRSIKI